MEPEGSLPHTEVPATCPYPEPNRSSPYPHIPLPEDPSEYYPPMGLPSGPHQNPVYTSPIPNTRYMPRPSHSSLYCHLKILVEECLSLSSSLCSFLYLEWEMFRTKVVEKIKTYFMFNNFFSTILPSWDNVKKYCRAGHVMHDNMAHAHCTVDT